MNDALQVRQMKIVAIHDGHNASACLLADGKLRFAIQEERLSRIKNHSAFPERAIRFLLDHCSLRPADVDAFLFSTRHMPRNKDRETLMEEYRTASSVTTRFHRALKRTPAYPLYATHRSRERIGHATRLGFARERIQMLDHHLCHAAAAYYGSPWWSDEPVLVLTNDAGGDGLCATVSIGKRGKLERVRAVPVSESVGYMYSMITFLLGMVPEEHEYKVMGLAPYSSKDKHRALKLKLAELVRFDEGSQGTTWKRSPDCPHAQYSFAFFRDFLQQQRFDWVCGALQEFLEDFLLQWVRHCIRAYGIRKVALSGGVFMNVKANKRIMEMDEVDSVFIFPSCGDETNSFGAAYAVYARECLQNGREIDVERLGTLCLGPEYSDQQIETVLKEIPFPYRRCEDIERATAQLLSQGSVVARFKGRMEFGARALGNRSILAHPTRREVVRTINEMIKNRDFWMPFAPSLLPEDAARCLVNPKGIDAPYMILSFDLADRREHLAAACHPYDFTVRPQVVNGSWNPDYCRLLREFQSLTGESGVLNTSFNLHGYPIVCSPKDALQVFADSGLEYMAIGSYLVQKNDGSPTARERLPADRAARPTGTEP